MAGDRLLLDTVYIQALLNNRDSYHQQALLLFPIVRDAAEVWVTEAVLVEVGNALSTINRMIAAQFIQQCYQTENMHVVNVSTSLLNTAVELYRSRPDKTWSLTDCISFVVMSQEDIVDAVTTDRHFSQAGYRALMAHDV
jgi:predicted nucleic acid-binding protein